MDWVRILAFADATQDGVARVLTARHACLSGQDAQLDVCVATLLPEMFYAYGDGVIREAHAEAVAQVRQEAQQALEALRRSLRASDDRTRFLELQGDVATLPKLAAALGRGYDVIVLAQPGGSQRSVQNLLLKGALLGSGRPCLILPQWTEPRSLSGRAIVAWKGTPEAARAVRDAVPLLRRMQVTRFFEAAEGDAVKGEGQEGLTHLSQYLAAHGVRVEPPTISPPPDEVTDPAGQAITDEASALSADLLVMGGFGHARLVEIMFGGATQTVIKNANCAVLMSH